MGGFLFVCFVFVFIWRGSAKQKKEKKISYSNSRVLEQEKRVSFSGSHSKLWRIKTTTTTRWKSFKISLIINNFLWNHQSIFICNHVTGVNSCFLCSFCLSDCISIFNFTASLFLEQSNIELDNIGSIFPANQQRKAQRLIINNYAGY